MLTTALCGNIHLVNASRDKFWFLFYVLFFLYMLLNLFYINILFYLIQLVVFSAFPRYVLYFVILSVAKLVLFLET